VIGIYWNNQGKRISESILGYRFSRRKIGENI
jgi:hypothetical protein